jgi:hypothetical protein
MKTKLTGSGENAAPPVRKQYLIAFQYRDYDEGDFIEEAALSDLEMLAVRHELRRLEREYVIRNGWYLGPRQKRASTFAELMAKLIKL